MSQTLKIAQELITIPSASANEAQILQWITRFLAKCGLEPQKINNGVVCKLVGSNSTKALVFNGHVDTVGPGDLAAWHTPPLQAIVQNGKLYGLGASDMKSGVAVMLALAAQYSQYQPPIDLWFHFVGQEETSGQGTNDVMAWFEKNHLQSYTQIAGILLEPTSLACIEIAHKGNIFLKLATKGESGHGSTPEVIKQFSFVEMQAAIEELYALVGSWVEQYSDTILGKPTVVLTSIMAGDVATPNKVPDRCTATFDLRTTPALHDKALDLIKNQLSDHAEVQTVYEPLPCGYTAENEHIVQLVKQITGLPITSTPGSTDMLFFTALGIPAIIVGPGEKSVEHKANEFVELDKIEKTITYMNAIIERF